MGVQGLTSLLEKNCRAQVVCVRPPQEGSAANPQNVLLVDASAVQYVLLDRLGSSNADWRSTAFAEALYKEICHFYAGIQKCGLHPVLICDGACR